MILTPGRTRYLRKGVFQGKSVLYWMLRDKRVNDNWALIEAQKIAIENNVPLKVCFNINNNYPEANLRQYKNNANKLEELLRQDPGTDTAGEHIDLDNKAKGLS